jgi:hypothetical protein
VLKYVRRKYKQLNTRPLRATDVLYEKMHTYNKEAKLCLQEIIKMISAQNKNAPALRELYLLMAKADDIVIDCAHKLAPYQDARLQAIEVKTKVEHRFVLRAPTPVKNVQEWINQTGAEKLLLEDKMGNKIEVESESAPAPSIHDFEEDEVETNKRLLN